MAVNLTTNWMSILSEINSFRTSTKQDKSSGPKFTVETSRHGNRMNIYVSPYGFDKYISLDKWGLLFTRSPRERITDAIEKAERIAEELNHKEDIMAHEATVSVRA